MHRAKFIDSIVRVLLLLCLAVLPTIGVTSASEGAPRRTAQKPKRTPPDTAVIAVKPLPPLLPFARLEQWEQQTTPDSGRATELTGPAANSVLTLCRYFGIGFDVTSVYRTSLSPLEWPLVFAKDMPNPRRQRREIEDLLRFNGLRYHAIVTEETGGMADALARGIATGAPVLLNGPGAPIIYGYDRRETDPWWWTQISDRREILYESERVKNLVYWTDEPSANLAWVVTGPDSGTGVATAVQPNDYAWLTSVSASVTGSEASGVSAYPLSIRAFHDRLVTARTLPELRQPATMTDPLGIRRARAARDFAVAILEHLSAMALDTALSQPLHLTLYFYHNATLSLDRLDSLLYSSQQQGDMIALCQANWANTARREKAATALTELLEWEKQASQQVTVALQVQLQSKNKHR